jgi:photosystem I subunit 11
MIIDKAQKFNCLDSYTTSTAGSSVTKKSSDSDVISPFHGDIFVGHLSTPITTSNITKTYLSLLPAYKEGLSPLLRGIHIGFVHGYFLLGPFVEFGPLRNSEVATFVGFISTLSVIIILTAGLLAYGYVSFSDKTENKTDVDFLTSKGWNQFTSGFITGGFGGVSIAYVVIRLIGTSLFTF